MNYVETKEEFAANIRYVRESLDLPQWKVANKLKIERSTYAYYEIGKTEMSVFHLIELENIFDVYIEDLIAKVISIKFRLLKKDVGKTKFVVQGRGIKRTYIKNKKELAENLKFFRTNAGLTQEKIAKELFIDRTTYAYYETEKTTPKPLMLIKIANIFNIEFSELVLRRGTGLSGVVSKNASLL